MKSNIIFFIVIISIIILGGLLRFYNNTLNPPSLNGDEISFAYSAYSVLETGKDEYGKFMPLTFQSVGDYKNPLPAYLMTLPIKLFGLNEFSVRFQNALIGTLMIFVFFLFLKNIFKDKVIATTGAFFLSISSWHIFYSRFAYEPLIASFFILLGIWFFIKMLNGGYIWSLLSAFFLTLTMYTAFAPRLFIPLFVVTALIVNFRRLKANLNNIAIFVLACFVFGLPLVYVSIFESATTRLSMVFIANDIDFIRYVIFHYMESIDDVFLLIFFWLKRYLNYLQPEFLFINGLNMTLPGTFGLGLVYLFELPWLVLGIVEFIRRKIPYKNLFIIWLLTGIIPDSITNNQQHAGRLLHIAPVVILITTLGAVCFFKWIFGLSKVYMKAILLGGFFIFSSVILIHAFLTFYLHFPQARGEAFDEGLKQAALYIRNHQSNYKEIVFDPRRGVEGPYIVSNPYLYVLFYTEYNPFTYQTEPKLSSKDATYFYKFNKYTFRNINWMEDRERKDTLFIGSPWSFPEKEFKEGELLEKIYISNGRPAFYIVSPK